MTDEELRNYLAVLSFLLAALSFLANERREAIGALHERSNVKPTERWLAIVSVLLIVLAAFGLLSTAWPAVHATGLNIDDLFRLDSAVRQTFVMGWLLLGAMTLALVALLIRAWNVKTGS